MTGLMVSFYEEFPTEKNLEKLDLIDFPSKIYVAANSLQEFYELKEKIIQKNKYIQEVIYWVLLNKTEGYWISPWSDTSALTRIFTELEERQNKEPITLLLDLELPYQKRGIKLLNPIKFMLNKHTITSFIKEAKENNISIITVENSYLKPKILRLGGLSYNPSKYKTKRTTMFYDKELIPDLIEKYYLKEKIKENMEETRFMVSLGCIATGINNNEAIISPELLESNLKITKDLGIKEAIIFRLGGLNKGYLKVIKKFR